MKTRTLLPAFITCTAIMTGMPVNASTPHANFNPFLQSLGLRVTDKPSNASWQLQGELSLSNEYQRETRENELLILDYEQLRLDLSLQHRLNDNWRIGVNAGFFNQGGGFGDAVIDGWHDFFSLPENGRNQVPRDQFNIRYQRNGQTIIDLDKGNGLAYASVNVSRSLGQNRGLHWTLSLPGSDSYQIASTARPTLSMAYSQHWAHDKLGQFSAEAGFSYRDKNGALAALQNEWLFSGSVGWTYPLFETIGILLQLDANSAAYQDTGLATLESAAGVISVALTTKRWRLGFREDLLLGKGSPDFGLFFSLHHRL